MAHAVDSSASLWTAVDLVNQLGPIPLHRIVSHPAPGSATVEDVVRMEEHEDRLCELIDGCLVEKTYVLYESFLTAVVMTKLQNSAQSQALGIVLGPDGMMQLFPNQVRMPDASFISWASLEGSGFPDQPAPDLAPDLAVEIISRGNTQEEMDRKLREYFEAGVRYVWYFYSKTKTMNYYTAPDQVSTFGEGDTIRGGDVLPGFSLELTKFFATPKPS